MATKARYGTAVYGTDVYSEESQGGHAVGQGIVLSKAMRPLQPEPADDIDRGSGMRPVRTTGDWKAVDRGRRMRPF